MLATSATSALSLSFAASACAAAYGIVASWTPWLMPRAGKLLAMRSDAHVRRTLVAYMVLHTLLGLGLMVFQIATSVRAASNEDIEEHWIRRAMLASAVNVALVGGVVGSVPSVTELLAKMPRGGKIAGETIRHDDPDAALKTRWMSDLTCLDRAAVDAWNWRAFKQAAPARPRTARTAACNAAAWAAFWLALTALLNAGLLTSLCQWLVTMDSDLDRKAAARVAGWAESGATFQVTAMYSLTLGEAFIGMYKRTWRDISTEPVGTMLLGHLAVPSLAFHFIAQPCLVPAARYLRLLSYGAASPSAHVVAIWKVHFDGGVNALLMAANVRARALQVACVLGSGHGGVRWQSLLPQQQHRLWWARMALAVVCGAGAACAGVFAAPPLVPWLACSLRVAGGLAVAVCLLAMSMYIPNNLFAWGVAIAGLNGIVLCCSFGITYLAADASTLAKMSGATFLTLSVGQTVGSLFLGLAFNLCKVAEDTGAVGRDPSPSGPLPEPGEGEGDSGIAAAMEASGATTDGVSAPSKAGSSSREGRAGPAGGARTELGTWACSDSDDGDVDDPGMVVHEGAWAEA